MKTLAVVNQKGGVGKTTTAFNLGTALSLSGFKVLLVDLDPQAHLSYSAGIKADELETTVYDVLKGDVELTKTIIQTGSISILPASIDLSGAEMELSNEVGRELFLKTALKDAVNYDFCIIDCPPNFGLLTLNALTASQEVLVPMLAEFFSLKGLDKLLNLVDTVNCRINPSVSVTGILVTMFDNRLKLHNDVFERLREYFPDKRLKTAIRKNVALAEATSFGKSIFEYAPKSHGAEDYRNASNEIICRGEIDGAKKKNK